VVKAGHHGCDYFAKLYQGEVALEIGDMPISVALHATAVYEAAMTAAHGVLQLTQQPRTRSTISTLREAPPETGQKPAPPPMGPVEVLAGQIAIHLGDGWTTVTDPNPYYDGTWRCYLVHRDGRRVGIQGEHRGWDSQGRSLPAERVRAWGVFPPTERQFGVDERPETTAAITRGARAIAKQLASDRFMGRYVRALQAVVDYNADQAARTTEMEAAGQRFADLLAHGGSVQPTAYNCVVRSFRAHRDFTARISNFGVRLDLGYMPPPVALAVTAAFATAMTDHRARPESTVSPESSVHPAEPQHAAEGKSGGCRDQPAGTSPPPSSSATGTNEVSMTGKSGPVP
jgi:hypothetical protein